MTDDLISRADAIDAIEITPFEDYGDYITARKLIETLQSAQPKQEEPTWEKVKAYCEKRCLDIVDSGFVQHLYNKQVAQPKRGEWVNYEEPCVNGGYWHYVMCTACKEKAITPTNFCPNCGARMTDSENPNNCEDDEYWKHLFIEVVKGHMSDAGANQAWYEYINHKDEPQTERSK